MTTWIGILGRILFPLSTFFSFLPRFTRNISCETSEDYESYRSEPTRLVLSHNLLKFHKIRSEEHTSELQSLAYLVCRLLLEKKIVSCLIVIWGVLGRGCMTRILLRVIGGQFLLQSI